MYVCMYACMWSTVSFLTVFGILVSSQAYFPQAMQLAHAGGVTEDLLTSSVEGGHIHKGTISAHIINGHIQH